MGALTAIGKWIQRLAAKEPPPPTRPRGPLNVLVVVDDEAFAQCLAVSIERNGQRVVRAIGREEALRIVDSFSPGMVLVDITMQYEDGEALAVELEGKCGNAVVFVAMGDGKAEGPLPAPFDFQIPKPDSVDTLKCVLGL